MFLSKEEGGRHTPFFSNYRPQFYFRTTDVTGVIELPEGVEMVMPGDNFEMKLNLLLQSLLKKVRVSLSVRVDVLLDLACSFNPKIIYTNMKTPARRGGSFFVEFIVVFGRSWVQSTCRLQ